MVVVVVVVVVVVGTIVFQTFRCWTVGQSDNCLKFNWMDPNVALNA